MPARWGRYIIDYVDHPKFCTLHANALGLWWQVKNYCDKYHTDGLIARDVVLGFRYYSQKALEQLTTSRALKPNGAPFAPLLDALDLGGIRYYRMHDYLEHNQCRDEALEAIEDANDKRDLRKLKDKERKRKERADRKAEIERLKALTSADASADSPQNVRGQSVDSPRVSAPVRTPIEVEAEVAIEASPSERKNAPGADARSKRPIFTGQRLTVFEWQLTDCENTLGPHVEQFRLDEWFHDVDARAVRDGLVIPKRDGGVWLQQQLVAEAQRRGIPLAFASTTKAEDFDAEVARLVAKGPSIRPVVR